MHQFAIFALITWVPITIALFTVTSSRTAVVASVIGGWLLLPPITIPIPGFPDYSKFTAATFGVLIGTLLFETRRLIEFRPKWFDAPMLIWCFCPFAAAMANGNGLYDGSAQSLTNIFLWGIPYLVGRLYFGDLESFRALVVGVVTGGVACIPPCVWEMRMSPILLPQVYGVSYRTLGMRLGGYRPRIFFSNSLELGMWMSVTSLAAWWIWRAGSLKQIASISMGKVLLPCLLVVNIFCRSSGALTLFALGVVTLWGSVRFKTRILLFGVILATPSYYAARITQSWSGEGLLDVARATLGQERAWSVEFRFRNEDLLIERALERPIIGWGGWSRARKVDSEKLRLAGVAKKAIPDGLWIIAFGDTGAIGLASLTFAILLPPLLFLKRYPPEQWLDPLVAPAAVFAVILSLYMIDCLANAMINLVYIVAIGGMASAVSSRSRLRHDDSSIHPENNFLYLNGPSAAPAYRIPQYASPSSAVETLAGRYTDMGRSLAQRGRRGEAKTAWFHALELWSRAVSNAPDDSRTAAAWSDCCNDLACFLIEEPRPELQDFPRAVSLASQASEAFPDEPLYWNTLGAACYRAGDAQAAVDALHRSVSLQPEHGTAFDHLYLAMACAQLAQPDVALSWYEQGVHWIQEHASNHDQLQQLAEEAGRRVGRCEQSETRSIV